MGPLRCLLRWDHGENDAGDAAWSVVGCQTGDTMVEDLTITALDADGAVLATVGVPIEIVNVAPTVAFPRSVDAWLEAREPWSASVPFFGVATDTFTVESDDLPDGAAIAYAGGVLLEWTPRADQHGEWPISWTVTDEEGSAFDDGIVVTVARGCSTTGVGASWAATAVVFAMARRRRR